MNYSNCSITIKIKKIKKYLKKNKVSDKIGID